MRQREKRGKKFFGSGAILAYKMEIMKAYAYAKLVFELTSSQSIGKKN